MTKAKSIRICLVMMCIGGKTASLVRHVEMQDLERSQASFIFSHSAYGQEVATGCDFNAIDSLLQVEGMKLDPDPKSIMESLDACLDFNPKGNEAWVRLGKALIAFAGASCISRKASSTACEKAPSHFPPPVNLLWSST
jgi:hypothetical protein